MKPLREPLRTLLFCERMKRLLFHHLPLKEQMKDYIISNVHLLCPNSFLSRLDEDLVPEVSKRLALWKLK